QNFLPAWCDLANAHMDLYWYGSDHTPARLAQASAALDKAVRIDANAGETHLALASYHYRGFRDYERARTELALARLTLPNEAEIPYLAGCVERRQNRWSDSERNLRRALELDPRNPRIQEQLAINYRLQRRYREEDEMLARALELTPGSIELKQARGRIKLDAQAEPAELCETLSAVLREQPEAAGDIAQAMLECALCSRDGAAAEHALRLIPAAGIPLHGATYPRAWFEALLARSFGDEARARAAFASARNEAERVVQAQPDFAFAHSVLGLINAGLGHGDEAVASGQRAIELLPVERDAIDGPELLINVAVIATWRGERDAAMDHLEEAARIPSLVSYGLLKLHPQWDALRGTPRFEALIAKLKPAGEE
ncbi:MAG TPA: hypothetical protein VF683_04655, partial [Chthoniobacterales bacterium]